MQRYNKLIVAAVGLVVMLAHDHLGLDLGAQQEAIVELVVAALTAWGVYQVPNQPSGGA